MTPQQLLLVQINPNWTHCYLARAYQGKATYH